MEFAKCARLANGRLKSCHGVDVHAAFQVAALNSYTINIEGQSRLMITQLFNRNIFIFETTFFIISNMSIWKRLHFWSIRTTRQSSNNTESLQNVVVKWENGTIQPLQQTPFYNYENQIIKYELLNKIGAQIGVRRKRAKMVKDDCIWFED
jgi:hypothetical protein